MGWNEVYTEQVRRGIRMKNEKTLVQIFKTSPEGNLGRDGTEKGRKEIGMGGKD